MYLLRATNPSRITSCVDSLMVTWSIRSLNAVTVTSDVTVHTVDWWEGLIYTCGDHVITETNGITLMGHARCRPGSVGPRILKNLCHKIVSGTFSGAEAWQPTLVFTIHISPYEPFWSGYHSFLIERETSALCTHKLSMTPLYWWASNY